jgi:hypothetical protein
MLYKARQRIEEHSANEFEPAQAVYLLDNSSLLFVKYQGLPALWIWGEAGIDTGVEDVVV